VTEAGFVAAFLTQRYGSGPWSDPQSVERVWPKDAEGRPLPATAQDIWKRFQLKERIFEIHQSKAELLPKLWALVEDAELIEEYVGPNGLHQVFQIWYRAAREAEIKEFLEMLQ